MKTLDEKWLLSKGWIKTIGYRVSQELFSEGEFATAFFEEPKKNDAKITFYISPHEDNFRTNNLDDCIKHEEKATSELEEEH